MTEDDHGRFGSLAAVTGKWAGSDNYLPDWLEEGTESSLRDTEADIPQVPVYTSQSSTARSIASSSKASPVVLSPSPSGSFTKQEATKAAYMDLDKFHEDAEEAEETESESEESDEDEDGTDSGSGSDEADSTEEGSEEDEEEDGVEGGDERHEHGTT